MEQKMQRKIMFFAAMLGAGIAMHARAQPTQNVTVTKDVMDATDQWARDYGAGSAPRASVKGAEANPTLQGTNDLDALVDQYSDNATFAGTLQPFWLRGKTQVRDLWSRYFARYPDRRLIFRDRDVQVYGDAAVETGYAEMYMGASPLTSVVTFMRYSITRVLRDGKWVIVSQMVDRLPTDQPPPGNMPAWANTPPTTP
jgi:ketosteroid isomerase-like protein